MDIIYKHGDLMRASEAFILHGCNAQGVMGSGVAKLIRDRYPKAYEEYAKAHKQSGLVVGECIWVETSPHTVINGITQEFYGRDPNVVYVSYDGLRAVIRNINERIGQSDGTIGVAMPLIGAGLANGRWSIISEIIKEEATNFQPVVYLVDGIVPDGIIPATEIVRA